MGRIKEMITECAEDYQHSNDCTWEEAMEWTMNQDMYYIWDLYKRDHTRLISRDIVVDFLISMGIEPGFVMDISGLNNKSGMVNCSLNVDRKEGGLNISIFPIEE